MHVEQTGPMAEVRPMAESGSALVLPEVDHLVPQRVFRLAAGGMEAERSRNDDLQRMRREVPVATAHPPAEVNGDPRERSSEVGRVHTFELGLQPLEVGYVHRIDPATARLGWYGGEGARERADHPHRIRPGLSAPEPHEVGDRADHLRVRVGEPPVDSDRAPLRSREGDQRPAVVREHGALDRGAARLESAQQ
jgi:hypothetical protein